MEGLPLDLVQLILEWTVLPPHQLSEGRRRSKKDSQQGHLVQPPPGERLLQRHGLFGAVRSTPRPIPIPTEPKSLFAFKQQLQKHTRIRSLPNCVVVASVSRRWRAIVLDLVPFDVLSLLSLKRLVRVSLGIGLADQGALTLSQFDTFFHFLSSRPWRATVLDVAFPAFSPDGFNVLLSNILSAKLKYPSICCLDQSCSFPHDPSPSPCKHHTVPHNHHSPPPLHSLSLAFRGPEFFKQDAPPSPSTDPVWATVNAVLQHLCNHLESTPSTALSIKSLRIYIYPESKGRSPRRPDSARNGIRGPRISTVDSENDLEWTTASRLWSRVGKLCSKSLESLQVRIMGPLGDKGWILSDNGSSGSSVTTTTRRHVRVYEDETETTVFGLGSGSNSIGQAFSQQDWLDLEAFMRSPPSKASTSSHTSNFLTSNISADIPPSPPQSFSLFSSSSTSTLKKTDQITPNHHPTHLLLSLTSLVTPKLTHLRQESHGLNLTLLPTTLTTLHIRSPAWTLGTLTRFPNLHTIALGTGNWDDFYSNAYAGWGGGGGFGDASMGASGFSRGAGIGMRGAGGSAGTGFLEFDGSLAEERGVAVKRLLMGVWRDRVRCLAVGEVEIETVGVVFPGDGREVESGGRGSGGGLEKEEEEDEEEGDDDDEDGDNEDVFHEVESQEEGRSGAGGGMEVEEGLTGGSEEEDDEALRLLHEIAAMNTARPSGSLGTSPAAGTTSSSSATTAAAITASTSPFALLANTQAKRQLERRKRKRFAVFLPPTPQLPPLFTALTRLWLRVIPRPSLETIKTVIHTCPVLEHLDISFEGPATIAEQFIEFAHSLDVFKRARAWEIEGRSMSMKQWMEDDSDEYDFEEELRRRRRRDENRKASFVSLSSDSSSGGVGGGGVSEEVEESRNKKGKGRFVDDEVVDTTKEKQEKGWRKEGPVRLVVYLWMAERHFSESHIGSVERALRKATVLKNGNGVYIRFACDTNEI